MVQVRKSEKEIILFQTLPLIGAQVSLCPQRVSQPDRGVGWHGRGVVKAGGSEQVPIGIGVGQVGLQVKVHLRAPPIWPSCPQMGRSSLRPSSASNPQCQRTACQWAPSSGLVSRAQGSGHPGLCKWRGEGAVQRGPRLVSWVCVLGGWLRPGWAGPGWLCSRATPRNQGYTASLS